MFYPLEIKFCLFNLTGVHKTKQLFSVAFYYLEVRECTIRVHITERVSFESSLLMLQKAKILSSIYEKINFRFFLSYWKNVICRLFSAHWIACKFLRRLICNMKWFQTSMFFPKSFIFGEIFVRGWTCKIKQTLKFNFLFNNSWKFTILLPYEKLEWFQGFKKITIKLWNLINSNWTFSLLYL